MNEQHQRLCSSPESADAISDLILPAVARVAAQQAGIGMMPTMERTLTGTTLPSSSMIRS